jgi:hypothetical protein
MFVKVRAVLMHHFDVHNTGGGTVSKFDVHNTGEGTVSKFAVGSARDTI